MKNSLTYTRSSRLHLSYLMDPRQTPDSCTLFFLELSDYTRAFTDVFRPADVGRRLGVDWFSFFGNLKVDSLHPKARWRAALNGPEKNADLLLFGMPERRFFHWPFRYKFLLRYVRENRVPVLLVPSFVRFRPFKKILTFQDISALPSQMVPLIEGGNISNATVFKYRRKDAYAQRRFDELGCSRQELLESAFIRQCLESEDLDLVFLPPTIRTDRFRKLLNSKIPLLIAPAVTQGATKGEIRTKPSWLAASKFFFIL